jgi:hypothetical protein
MPKGFDCPLLAESGHRQLFVAHAAQRIHKKSLTWNGLSVAKIDS